MDHYYDNLNYLNYSPPWRGRGWVKARKKVRPTPNPSREGNSLPVFLQIQAKFNTPYYKSHH